MPQALVSIHWKTHYQRIYIISKIWHFNFHQTVSKKSTFDYPDHKTAKIIRNLRSRYYLKNYQNKINQNIDPKCECGQLETVEHYLLFCENYEEATQKLILEIYFNKGSLHTDHLC